MLQRIASLALVTCAAYLVIASLPARAQSEFALFSNADIPGHDYLVIENTDQSRCANACATAKRCNAFTFNTTKNVCFLKSKSGEVRNFAGANSGQRSSAEIARRTSGSEPPLASPAGFEILPDTDIAGNDLAAYSNATAEQCQASCAGNRQCAAFTHNIRKGVCFLKSASGQPAPFVGAVSGRRVSGQTAGAPPVFAERTKSTPLYDIYDGYDLAGGDLKGGGFGVDEQRCSDICTFDPACKAFTLNKSVANGTCITKGSISRPTKFRDAISGIRKPIKPVDVANGVNSGGFTLHTQADLLAAGYSEEPESPSIDDCQTSCLIDSSCLGFSFGPNRPRCKLMNTTQSGINLSPNPARTAGVKQSPDQVRSAIESYLKPGRNYPTADLRWRKDDTVTDFVARIRDASKPMGGACDVEKAAFDKAVKTVEAKVSERRAVAGQPFKLDWKRQNVELSVPAWINISFDSRVRVTGSGFYSLQPGAIAPFGIAVHKDRTRAMTALFGFDAPTLGTMDVIALSAGQLGIAVDVVGYLRSCGGELYQNRAEYVVKVEPAPTPTFQVNDPYSFERPIKTLQSPDLQTRLEIYDGRYRLVEASSGAIIADRDGLNPSYSPTGRYIAVRRGEIGHDIIDTIDGATVASIGDSVAGWENNDSFLIEGTSHWSSVNVRNLISSIGWDMGGGGCRRCSGLDTGVVIDLENDTLFIDGVGQRLSGHSRAMKRASGNEEDHRKRFLAVQAAAAPLSPTTEWAFRGGLRFSDLESSAGTPEPTSRHEVQVAEATFKAREIAAQPRVHVAGLAANRSQAGSIASPDRPVSARNSALERLKEFGVEVSAFSDPEVLTSKVREFPRTRTEVAEDKNIVRMISATNGKVRRVFEPYEGSCYPSSEAKVFGSFDYAQKHHVAGRDVWLVQKSCAEGSAAHIASRLTLFDPALKAGFMMVDGQNPVDMGATSCATSIGSCEIASRLVAERYMLIWSKDSRAMIVVDLKTHKTVHRLFELGRADLFQDAFYSVETRHLTQLNSDGSFFVYNADNGKQVLEGRYVDDEVIAWTSELRFDSTPEGANYVGLRFPGLSRQYAFQQFARSVKRPGLVREVFARSYKPESTALGVPPQLAGSLTLAGGTINGILKVSTASTVRLYQDGFHTDTFTTSGADLPVQTNRRPGTRWIAAVATDAAGLTSQPLVVELTSPPSELPVLHALNVGIDQYQGAGIPSLQFAKADATNLTAALNAQNGKSYKASHIDTLSNASASPEAIITKVQQLVDKAGAGDTIVFSFAGHGLVAPDGRFYMATTATETSDIQGTALAWDRLAAIFAKSTARVIVFLDACHAGAAGMGLFATNDNFVGSSTERLPPGLLVFAASKGRQLSEESPESNGGAFTSAVIDVIAVNRSAYDLNGNGSIEISELYFGVKLKVSKTTVGRQIPWLARNELVGDFAIF